MTNKNNILAIAIWTICETILQIHGVRFWAEHGGWQGWMWSPVLGVACVWFWLHRSAVVRYGLGVLASVLLLVGPLYQVGAPILSRIAIAQAQQQSATLQAVALQSAEAETVQQLQTYLQNSTQRSGWSPVIAQVQTRLDNIRQQQAQLTTTASGITWLPAAVVAIQLLALIVLQVAAVLALLQMRPVGQNKTLTPFKKGLVKSVAGGLGVGYENIADDFSGSIEKSSKFVMSEAAKKTAQQIAQQITAGRFGVNPSVRHVMAETGKRHPVVRLAFDLARGG